MSARRLRMTIYDLRPKAACRVQEGARAFVYAAHGPARVAGAPLAPGDGAFASPGAEIAAADGAWIYEIAPGAAAPRVEAGLDPVLSRVAELGDGRHILRADRVESPAGAQTPAHHHRGPGLRRLSRGLVRAQVGDHLDRIEAGGAWFETDRESVVGTNISDGVNAFVRVMALPAELTGGKSSFVPTTPVDAARPRGSAITLFGEIDLE